MSESDRARWNARHAAATDHAPEPFVEDALRLALELPPELRTVLDVACGRGRHALLFARAGFDVLGVDVSDVAVDDLSRRCAALRLPCRAERRDLDEGLPPGTFGVVLVSHFLDRRLWPALREAVARGGLLAAHVFTIDHARRTGFREELCVRPGELPEVARGWEVLLHRTDDDGERVIEGLVARRPAGTDAR